MTIPNTGLLVLTCLSKTAASLSVASKKVLKNLYIHYHPELTEPIKYEKYSKALSSIYSSSIELCGNLDVRVLISTMKDRSSKISNKSIDVLLLDDQAIVGDKVLENDSAESLVRRITSQLGKSKFPGVIEDVKYNDVVLGGTFDRIHVGHKILLSEAVLRAQKRVVVGVTDVNMIKTKKLPELVLSLDIRVAEVKRFLQDIDDSLMYDVMSIQDPFGPTASDPNMDLIVVSPETLRGGEKVNEIREQKNLKKLDIYCIPLIEIKDLINKEKEKKVSSSNQRMDILGSKFKEPFPRPQLPNRPYIIGLIGGIASGKSKMTERFQKMGAGVIDCDKLAHQLYEPGETCYEKVINAFGEIVIDEDGRIDRRRLGELVFGNKDNLTLLNGIVWPSLLEKSKQQIKHLHEVENYEIIILEAAVLLQAGWETECHEIWSCIIPREEAAKRLMARNALSEEEAKVRIASQMGNSVVVQNSNVVFSSLWSYEYSQQQAEKAWAELNLRLKSKM